MLSLLVEELLLDNFYKLPKQGNMKKKRVLKKISHYQHFMLKNLSFEQ